MSYSRKGLRSFASVQIKAKGQFVLNIKLFQPFDPYHAPNSTYHAGQSHSGSEPSPAFVNLTQQFMENMPQSQWSQQIYAQHQSIPMNKETSYDSSSDSDVPTFDFRHKSFSRRECGPGSIPTGSNMSESQWKQMHSKQVRLCL